MTRAARVVEIILGVFFLLSAGLKAVDMDAFGVQVSAYSVVKDPMLVQFSAYFAVFVETLLGGALVAGLRFRGLTLLASSLMIVVYSTLIVYAWVFHGLTDCGCLGQLVTMGPLESLIKNLVLLVLFGFAWYGTRERVKTPVVGEGDVSGDAVAEVPHRTRNTMATAAAIMGVVVVVLLGAVDLVQGRSDRDALHSGGERDAARPFAEFVFTVDGSSYDLGQGDYIVAMLNSTCGHCQAAVPALNAIMERDGMPEMVALMMGSPEELAEFQSLTAPIFDAKLVEPLKFMQFIGTAPPRLIHVQDGVEVTHWDWEDEVPVDTIVQHFTQGTE